MLLELEILTPDVRALVEAVERRDPHGDASVGAGEQARSERGAGEKKRGGRRVRAEDASVRAEAASALGSGTAQRKENSPFACVFKKLLISSHSCVMWDRADSPFRRLGRPLGKRHINLTLRLTVRWDLVDFSRETWEPLTTWTKAASGCSPPIPSRALLLDPSAPFPTRRRAPPRDAATVFVAHGLWVARAAVFAAPLARAPPPRVPSRQHPKGRRSSEARWLIRGDVPPAFALRFTALAPRDALRGSRPSHRVRALDDPESSTASTTPFASSFDVADGDFSRPAPKPGDGSGPENAALAALDDPLADETRCLETSNRGTVLGAVALITGSTVGAGILALPETVAPAGFGPSSVVLCACWALLACEALPLAEVNVAVMRERDEYRLVHGRGHSPVTISLSEMAGRTLGDVGAGAVSADVHLPVHDAARRVHRQERDDRTRGVRRRDRARRRRARVRDRHGRRVDRGRRSARG